MGEPFTPEGRGRPQTDALGFDHRLMTPERLLTLAGRIPLRVSGHAQGIESVSLDCTSCAKAVDFLTDRRGGRYILTAQQLLSNVLRHQVMRHELQLSGGGHGGR